MFIFLFLACLSCAKSELCSTALSEKSEEMATTTTRDWSQLPQEMLAKIAKNLEINFEYLHFRSVCHSWRFSTSSSHPTSSLTPKFPYPIIRDPHLADKDVFPGFCNIVKNTIYSLQPQNELPACSSSSSSSSSSETWLMKVQATKPNMLHFAKNPLSGSRFKKLPKTLPKEISTLGLKIFGLGEEYLLERVESDSELEREEYCGGPYPAFGIQVKTIYIRALDKCDVKKVVLSARPTMDDFVAMVIHIYGKLAFFKSGDVAWSVLKDEKCQFHDIIHYEGRFYAVDSTGRACIVDPHTSKLSVVAEHVVNGGRKKRFVESKGELFLVDLYIDFGSQFAKWDEAQDPVYYSGDGRPSPAGFYGRAIPKGCKVYKLDEDRRDWIHVDSLGDCLFFLGAQSSFSISTTDFVPGCEGNCIIFQDDYFYDIKHHEDDALNHSIGVFNMEDGSFGILNNYPRLLKLIWPSPTWVAPTNLC